MADAPSGPHKGLVTSLAATTVTQPSAAWRLSVSMWSRRARALPPGGSEAPEASRNRAPRAVAIPAPPSLVALPPRPTMILVNPRSRASRRISPVPAVVVILGLRRRWGTRASPRGQRHLDHGGVAVAHHSPPGLQRPAQRPGNSAGEHLAARAAHQRVQGTVAAVGDGRQHRLGVGRDSGHAAGDGPGGLQSGNGRLESLGSDDNLHEKTHNLDAICWGQSGAGRQQTVRRATALYNAWTARYL